LTAPYFGRGANRASKGKAASAPCFGLGTLAFQHVETLSEQVSALSMPDFLLQTVGNTRGEQT